MSAATYGTIITVISGLAAAYTAASRVFRPNTVTVPASADPQALYDAGASARDALDAARNDLANLEVGGNGTGNVPIIDCPAVSDRRAFTRWTTRVIATVAANTAWFGKRGRLHAWLLGSLAADDIALDAYLVDPVPDSRDFSPDECVATARDCLEGLKNLIGWNDLEARAEAITEYSRLYQGNDAFGVFFSKLVAAGIRSGRLASTQDASSDPAFAADLVRKTRSALRERVITNLGNPVPDARSFSRAALLLDASTPRSAATTGANKPVRANPFVVHGATFANQMGRAKWHWDAAVPNDCRGSLTNKDGTRNMDLQNRLTAANRCWFCRNIGHGSTAAAARNCPHLNTGADGGPTRVRGHGINRAGIPNGAGTSTTDDDTESSVSTE
jgi:hypothetical protein